MQPTVYPCAPNMKLIIASFLFVVCYICAIERSQCARILAIIPTPSYSHQIPYRKLLIELNKRGHEIVLITPNPIPNFTAANFTQIDIAESYSSLKEVDFLKMKIDGVSWYDFTADTLPDIMEQVGLLMFNNTESKKLYAPDSKVEFDLVLVEFLHFTATLAFPHRFNAPFIGLSSLGLLGIHEFNLGGILLPSHEYTWENEANTGSNLPFLKRLRNFLVAYRNVYTSYNDIFPRQQKLAEQYFGPLPPLIDVAKNVSMLFVDQADILTAARPKLANMITFTCTHIDDTIQPLPKDLQKFLDDAKEGFVYMSLGSNAKSASLPKEIHRTFQDTFEKLPYKVLWKYEKELPNKPKNVYTVPWVNQQSVLAHPNIKLFIYQGGLQSTDETVHYGVPVLGIPILADQDYQVGRMVALGIGKSLDILTLTAKDLERDILELIRNKEYKEKMLYVRKLVKDTQIETIENLVWWTEYVIRTKGAPHLRSNLAFQPWYQRNDMDIIVFLGILSFLIVSTFLSLVAKSVLRPYKILQAPANKKQKVS